MDRTLILAPNRIGDAILASGAVDQIVKTYPESRYTVAASGAVAELWRHFPARREFVIFEKKPFNRHWLGLWPKLRKFRWRRVIDFRRSWIVALLSYDSLVVRPRKSHTVHQVRLFGSMIGENAVYPPVVWRDVAENPSGDVLKSGPPILRKKFAVLAIGASWREKTWDNENFLALMSRLRRFDSELGFAVLAGKECYWGQGLVDAADRDLRLSGSVVNGVDRYSLSEVVEIIDRAVLVIGHDTGLVHLAAALSKPVVALFGDSDPVEYAPYEVAGQNNTVTISGIGPSGDGSMKYVDVDRVYAAATKLLSS